MDDEDGLREQSIEELKQIPSIGELTSRKLVEKGIETVSQLKELEVDDLKVIRGVGEKRAERIIQELHEKGGVDDSGRIEEEFECPKCGRYLSVKSDRCEECGETIDVEEPIFLPDREPIKDPKYTLAEFEKMIMDGDESAETWFGRGVILDKLGAKREALRSYDKVIELDPLFEAAWNAKARVSMQLGKRNEAARAYKVAFDRQKEESGLNLKQIESEEEEVNAKTDRIEGDVEQIKEIEETISRARESLLEIRDKEVPVSDLIERLDQAVSAKSRDDLQKALDKSETVAKDCFLIEEFVDKSEEIKEKVQEVSDREKTRYIDKLEKLNGLLDIGKYEKAVDEVESILIDLENDLEGTWESKTRRLSKEEKQEAVKAQHESKSPANLKKMLTEMKSFYKNADKYGFDLEGKKDLFEEVLRKMREEDYDEAFDLLVKAKEEIDIAREERMEEMKEEVMRMIERSREGKEAGTKLQEAEKAKAVGDHKKALELTYEAKEMIQR